MSRPAGPRELPHGVIAQLFVGASYPFGAVRFMQKHRLWALAVVPAVVSLVLFVLLALLLIWLVGPWLTAAGAWLDSLGAGEGFFAGLLAAAASVLRVLLWVLAPLAIVALAAVLLVLVGQVVASPFLDLLSEKVEEIVLPQSAPPQSVARVLRSVGMAVGDLVWSLLLWAAVSLPLLLLNVIPAVGSAVGAVLGTCFAALLLAQEFTGLPLCRRLVSYPARWRVVWHNRPLSLGFGFSTMLLLMVPGLNLLLLPLAAVGGTLLYCDLSAAGRVALPPAAKAL